MSQSETSEHVLLIDDDEVFVRVLARALGARGLRVAANAEQVEFGVRDYGTGTEADLLARSAFQSGKRDGLGLGLALAHATAERLGGELRAELQPDRGLLQRLRVPLEARATNARQRL